jgi:hypothetical protein
MNGKFREYLLRKTLQMSAKLIGGFIGALFLGVLLSQSGFAQTLVAIPNCGVAGQTEVCVTGSGWAEPAPPCFYRFFFDGVQVVTPDQPDGLFGPPRRKFTVPAGATPGMHMIKVELRITATNQLLQSKSIPFMVVSSIAQPWSTSVSTTMDFTFDPKDVCDVTPCKKIVFIQVIEQLGVKMDGTTRSLTFAEQGFNNAATLDADVINGLTVDYIVGENDPYYNGDDASDIGMQGKQSNTPMKANTTDTPQRTDGAYPADITKIRLKFEVAAFCAEGDNAGEYLGKLLWTWERTKGAVGFTGTISGVSFSRDQPTQGFKDAASKWNTNHGFTMKFPMMNPSPCQ